MGTMLNGVELPDPPKGCYWTLSVKSLFLVLQLRSFDRGVEDAIWLRDSTAENMVQGAERILEVRQGFNDGRLLW